MLYGASKHIQELVGAFFQYENAVFNGQQEKRLHYLCEDRIEKSIPRTHSLSSLGKPCDAKCLSSRLSFLSHLYTDDGFFIILHAQLSI